MAGSETVDRRMGETMDGAVRKIVTLVGSLSLVALPLTASADEGSAGDPAPTDDLQLVYYYESTLQSLLYGFFAPDADPDACTPVDTTDADGETPAAEGETTAVGGETTVGSSECEVLPIEGSGDEVNHGSFLSAFIKAVKASFEGDTPFGHYVREFAQSDLGKSEKSEKSEKGSDDAEDADGDDGPGSDKGNNGNAHGKGKKGS